MTDSRGDEQEGKALRIGGALTITRAASTQREIDAAPDPLAIDLSGQGVAHSTGQLAEDGGGEQERPDVVGLAVEHLLDQVVQDVAMAAREALDEPRDSLRRQRGS